MAKILAFAGSTRSGSLNQKLLSFAAEKAREGGVEVSLIDLRDFPMPLYNGDLEDEHGVPEHAARLGKLIHEHEGLLLACPEYNGSITPLLKNTIDWVTRTRDGEHPLAAFKGKIATLLSASPGRLGGLRGLEHVRSILNNVGVIVLPDQVAVGGAHEAFDEAGSLLSEATARMLEGAVKRLVQTTQNLSNSRVPTA